MKVSNGLKEYIEKNIYPMYDDNYIGDKKDRIKYVIERSEKIISDNKLDIDYDILYTAISYHDIRINNNEKKHELASAQIMYNDDNLKEFLTENQRRIAKEAIEDQRSNLKTKPRSIYGEILSSASRNSTVVQCLERSYNYGKKKNPNLTDEELFNRAYEALLNKFGKEGYAKFYFKDEVYEKFLTEIRDLLSDKEKFINTQREYIKKLK